MLKRTAAFTEEILEELFEETDDTPAKELLPLSGGSKKKTPHGMNFPQMHTRENR